MLSSCQKYNKYLFQTVFCERDQEKQMKSVKFVLEVHAQAQIVGNDKTNKLYNRTYALKCHLHRIKCNKFVFQCILYCVGVNQIIPCMKEVSFVQELAYSLKLKEVIRQTNYIKCFRLKKNHLHTPKISYNSISNIVTSILRFINKTYLSRNL